jgi:hypothetical protein
MKRIAAVALMTFALAACETTGVGPAAPPPVAIAAGELDLGDYRGASEAATLQAFQQNAAVRYAAGVHLDAAMADLSSQQFNCSDAPEQDNGRGDPPVQVCRRTLTQNNCTHTWQVHLYDNSGDGVLTRTRGLYDRRCGNEGLLGGPGGG